MSNSGGPSNSDINNLALVPVSSIMVHDVKTVREDQTILDVCKMMHQNDIGSIVVVRGNNSSMQSAESRSSLGEPTGIITERDIVRHIATKLIAIQAQVQDVMSKPLVTIRPETSLVDAIQTMQSKDFRRLVVVDSRGKMVGIITDKDIFRAIARNQRLVSGLLSDQPLPSSSMVNRDIIDQLKMETLGELFRTRP
jgi:CBS domain-containing protein